jgi:hypothetical protein
MKLGKGHNEYHLNTATMIAILNKHIEYNTDQVVTGVRYVGTGSSSVFVVTLEDKRPEEKAR